MEAIDFIRSGKLGDYGPFEPLIRDIFEGKDHCMLNLPFMYRDDKLMSASLDDRPRQRRLPFVSFCSKDGRRSIR